MTPSTASGRFVLRLDPGLHAALREAARKAGLSLNDYCVRKLSMPLGDPGAFPEASAVVARAARLAGEHLAGVVVYGSWSRGALLESSDVDVLVVLERSLPLTRGLYRAWDESPLQWNAHPVEPHFVHLPPVDEAAGGIWAEVALDGVVLFDSSGRVSRFLVRVRHDIVVGRLVRKILHGQPYWTRVA